MQKHIEARALRAAAQGLQLKRGSQSNASVNILNKFYGNFVSIHCLENSKGSRGNHNAKKTSVRIKMGNVFKKLGQVNICLKMPLEICHTNVKPLYKCRTSVIFINIPLNDCRLSQQLVKKQSTISQMKFVDC